MTGAGAFAVKAGTGYTLYLTDDISVINWSTVGLTVPGPSGNQPALSHLALYTRPTTPPPPSIPEPMMILGTVVAAGAGLAMKRRNG